MLPWYFGPVIFLGALIVILIILLTLYKYADVLLVGIFSKDIGVSDTVARLKPAKRSTFSSRMRSEDEEEDKGDHPLSLKDEDVKIDIGLRYLKTNCYLSGIVLNITGLPRTQVGGPHRVRLYLTLRTQKAVRFQRTACISTSKIRYNIPWGFTKISEEDIANSNLRIRLLGQREKLGMAIGREICYGEMYLQLKDVPLSEYEEFITAKLLPVAKPFPKSKTSQF